MDGASGPGCTTAERHGHLDVRRKDRDEEPGARGACDGAGGRNEKTGATGQLGHPRPEDQIPSPGQDPRDDGLEEPRPDEMQRARGEEQRG